MSVAHPKHNARPRPDPVEPTTAISLHAEPIVATTQDWHWLLQQGFVSSVRTSDNKKRRLDDSHAIALPKLPVRNVDRRPRLPPTLSGLHQPPPNAGLLPSISTDTGATSRIEPVSREDVIAQEAIRTVKPSRKSRNKWSYEETRDLLSGVARFGIGSWTAILKCSDYHFDSRTALDLKDRFRVCRPADYKGSADHAASRVRSNDRVSDADLETIGVTSSFVRNTRRKRHDYSDEEDRKLLQGFNTHGKAWAKIQQDPKLGLQHRTRTDLRDRLRTRYPHLLVVASGTAAESSQEVNDFRSRDHDRAAGSDRQVTSKHMPPPKLPLLDLDWAFDLDDIALGDNSVTLDRDILDWPFEKHTTVVDTTSTSASYPSLPSIANTYQSESWPQLLPDFSIHSSAYQPPLVLPALQSHGAMLDDIDKPSSAFLTFNELLS